MRLRLARVAVLLVIAVAGGSARGADVVHTPAVPAASHPGEIVGVLLQNVGNAALPLRDVTFGEVFRAGQVVGDAGLIGVAAEQRLPAQMDVKTRWPDGSVRMAVVTVAASPLQPGANLPVVLSLDKAAAAAAVDLAPLAQPGAVAVDLVLHAADGTATPRHVAFGTLLQAALAHGDASFWLRGPLVSEARVETPVAGSLRLVADLRRTAAGEEAADIQFDNDIAMQAQGGAASYDVTIRRNGAIVLARQGLHQFQYQTWHIELGGGDAAPVNVVHDVAALARTGAILNYDIALGADAAVIAADTASLPDPRFAPLGPGNIMQQMGTSGGRPDIGPQPLWNVLWLITGRADTAAFALAQADAGGSVPWHYYDPEARGYANTDAYPQLWVDPRGGSSNTTALTQQRAPFEQTGWDIDDAHQADLDYVPYLLTGRRYRLDQLEAQASSSILQTWPVLRHDGQAIVANGKTQVRDQAWSLRQVVEAAFIEPDGAPLQGYFRHVVDRNFSFLLDLTRDAGQGEAHGWVDGDYGSSINVIAPWQQDFFASSVILAAGMGVPAARRFLDWESNFLVGRFLAAGKGFEPHDGLAYNLAMGQPVRDAPLFQTWREIEQQTIASKKSTGGGWVNNTDLAYVTSGRATLAGLARVTGSAQARQAYAWLVASSPMVTAAMQQKDPTFAIVP